MIYLFVINGCGFCDKAKDMYKKHIENGLVVVKDISEAPGNPSGAPLFVNDKNNSSHLGLVEPPVLVEKLKITPDNTNIKTSCGASKSSIESYCEGMCSTNSNGYLTFSQLPKYHTN
jgi:hypothetical protein